MLRQADAGGRGQGQGGKKAKTRTIGAATFSLRGRKTAIVTFTFPASGRALLKADHGKLGATLTILGYSPGPASTQRKTVQLV